MKLSKRGRKILYYGVIIIIAALLIYLLYEALEWTAPYNRPRPKLTYP